MSEQAIDIYKILNYLPHRYPFILVDRIIECTPGESIVAIKNVTINEPFFPGHFPGKPLMPGVLITEAIAQTAGVLAHITVDAKQGENELFYLVGVDKARFKRPVIPGDQMEIHVSLLKRKRNMWVYNGEVFVGGKLVAAAELLCAQESGPAGT